MASRGSASVCADSSDGFDAGFKHSDSVDWRESEDVYGELRRNGKKAN